MATTTRMPKRIPCFLAGLAAFAICLAVPACQRSKDSATVRRENGPPNRDADWPNGGHRDGGQGNQEAAQIEGTIALKGDLKKSDIWISCQGLNDVASGVGFPFPPDDPGESSKFATSGTTSKSTLNWDKAKGLTFKHSGLPVGPCLVQVKWGEVYQDCKWARLADKDAKLKLDLVIDPSMVGTLEAMVPDKTQFVTVLPLDADGKLPIAKFNVGWFDFKVTPKDGKVVLNGVRAGKYRVSVGRVWADVEIKKGESAKAELKEDKLTLNAAGSFKLGGEITITALVREPKQGEMLELTLPKGLELVQGDEKQKVPPPGGAPASVVAWKLKAAAAGTYTIKVQSSDGATKTLQVKIPGQGVFE
jgi:hypothetical protein